MYLWLAAQEAASQENGDTDLIPRKCDIITVTGQAEKCELARAALLVRNSSCLSSCDGLVFILFILFFPFFLHSRP